MLRKLLYAPIAFAKAMEAALSLLWALVLVKLVPFRLWRAAIGPVHSDATAPIQEPSQLHRKTARTIGWRVERCAHYLPFEILCLPKAMAARWMLNRRGVKTQFYFGARRKGEEGTLDMHAWLKCGEVGVAGDSELSQYSGFVER